MWENFRGDFLTHTVCIQAMWICKPLNIHVCVSQLKRSPISPPRKLRSKNPKVALKLRAIWLIFGCKMLLWPFGTLPNFGNEQQNNIYRYYIGLMKCKLDIFGKNVFVHDNDRLYCKLRCNVISHSSPMASRVKRSMEARSCKFQTYSYKFRKGKITGAHRSNLPPNFPKMEDY